MNDGRHSAARRRGRLAFGAAVAFVLTAGAVSAPSASAPADQWALRGGRLPAGLPAGDNASFSRPSCPAPGECVAVGSYDIATGPESETQVALIESVSERQVHVIAAPVPGHVARTDASSALSAVSCWQPGSCVAVGGYLTLNGQGPPGALVETLANGVWTPTMIPETSAGTRFRHGGLSNVACNAQQCVALGLYRDAANDFHPFAAERTSDGTWTVHDLAVPAGNWNGQLELVSPACPPSGGCVFIANGNRDDDSTTEVDSYLVYRSGDVWKGVRFPTWNHEPIRAYTMECSSAGNCVALATIGADGRRQPLVAEVLTDGVLAREQITLPPAPNGRREPYPSSIDCPADGTCVAAVTDRVADTLGHQVTELGTVFLRRSDGVGWLAERAPVPPDGPSRPAWLRSVSCSTPTSCVAVGEVDRVIDGVSSSRPLVARMTGYAWTLRELGLPPGTDDGDGDGLYLVTCADPVCVATGSTGRSAADVSRTAGLVAIGTATQ